MLVVVFVCVYIDLYGRMKVIWYDRNGMEWKRNGMDLVLGWLDHHKIFHHYHHLQSSPISSPSPISNSCNLTMWLIFKIPDHHIIIHSLHQDVNSNSGGSPPSSSHQLSPITNLNHQSSIQWNFRSLPGNRHCITAGAVLSV